MNKYDIIVIGGGAAGLCAAITAKRKMYNGKVLLIERLPRVGKKLLTTGNGRCNITNENISASKFHSQSADFPTFCLSHFTNNDTKVFFRSIGVEIVGENDGTGREYPASFQAASVVDALRFALDEHGIETATETTFIGLERNGNQIKVFTDKENCLTDSVILCTGGLAGGERLGCDTTGYTAIKKLGHSITPLHPAITQIKTDTGIIRRFKGIKVNARISTEQNGQILRSEYGELLFCDYGISGPPVFQLSRTVSGKENCKAVIDFFPQKDIDSLYRELLSRRNTLKQRACEEFLNGYMNKRIGQYFTKAYGGESSKLCGDLTDNMIRKLSVNLKNFELEIKGTAGFNSAQVTAGGIDCREVYDDTMMSKKTDGVFFAGEILDVDGDCGGYNLQWAWSSASVAANNAVKYRSKLK